MFQGKERTSPNKFKSPANRKLKVANRSSRENDKKRKKYMRDNFGKGEKKKKKKKKKEKR